MRNAQRVFWIIILVLVSIVFLFGVISLSQAEGAIRFPSATHSPTFTLTSQPDLSQISTPTPLIYPCATAMPGSCPPTPPASLTATFTPTWTPTLPPTPTVCPAPLGWVVYTVLPGDTLEGLALRYQITSTAISLANCLQLPNLLPGQFIYLPVLQVLLPTNTVHTCRAPSGWVLYVVQQGDTLYHLGQLYGIPYTDIQHANCFTSTSIHIGQTIFVPPWAPHTPTPTIFFFDLSTPTETGTFYLPFETPETETPTPTDMGLDP